MTDLQPTDADRLAALEQKWLILTGRITALESRDAPAAAAPAPPADTSQMAEAIFEAIAGSQDTDALNRFQ